VTTADAPRQLVLLPTPARMSVGPDGKAVWTISVLGWVYAPISPARRECEGTLAKLSREVLGTLSPTPGAATPPGANRLARFFVDNLCNQKVLVRIVDSPDSGGTAAAAGDLGTQPQTLQAAPGDPFCRTLLLLPDEKTTPKLLPVTDLGGLFCGTLTISDDEARRRSPQGQPLRLQAELVGDSPAGQGPVQDRAEAFLIRDVASEVSIISDIDDTVRISHVSYKPALLKGTFYEPFRPTPGVAQLYDQWRQHSPGLSLHFISSSPLPLYKPLRDELMASNPFPLATYHLKWFRVSAGDSIQLLAKSPLQTKRRQIAPLLASYPHRRWALVGDTGEKDPEVYTNLLADKLVPLERVAGIFIRDVTCDAQGVHSRQVATGAIGAVEGAGRRVSRAVHDRLPDPKTCRERRFHDAFQVYAKALSDLPKPVGDAAWRKWCVFYGGDDDADQAAVPKLQSPELAALPDADRPAPCWPHSQAEFAAALAAPLAKK
jgi:hypothetical protein